MTAAAAMGITAAALATAAWVVLYGWVVEGQPRLLARRTGVVRTCSDRCRDRALVGGDPVSKHQNAAAMTLEEWEHFSPNHDPTRDGRCICGAHLSAPTAAAHETHVAEATRATT